MERLDTGTFYVPIVNVIEIVLYLCDSICLERVVRLLEDTYPTSRISTFEYKYECELLSYFGYHAIDERSLLFYP